MTSILECAINIAPALGGIAAFSYYACTLAERALKEPARERLIRALKTFRLGHSLRGSFVTFVFVSDSVFGEKLWSVRSATVSAVWTIAWLTILYGVGVLTSDHTSMSFTFKVTLNFLAQLTVVILAIIMIDLLSVTLTRALIRWSLPRGLPVVIFCAAADILLSAIMFYTAYTVGHSLQSFADNYSWTQAVEVFRGRWQRMPADLASFFSWPVVTTTSDVNVSFSPFFWSSMLTSMWMWLYVGGYLALAAAIRFEVLKAILKWDEQPLAAIAILFNLVCIAVGIAEIVICATH